ncbi:hypothetical protein LINPERHAP1_LOCUS23650 [Linum perenne]
MSHDHIHMCYPHVILHESYISSLRGRLVDGIGSKNRVPIPGPLRINPNNYPTIISGSKIDSIPRTNSISVSRNEQRFCSSLSVELLHYIWKTNSPNSTAESPQRTDSFYAQKNS